MNINKILGWSAIAAASLLVVSPLISGAAKTDDVIATVSYTDEAANSVDFDDPEVAKAAIYALANSLEENEISSSSRSGI
ncbi:MAG: hypothetical protein ACI9W4_002405 [Rhodothermales bacterium]|jgi:hypothetical protein